MNAKNSLLVLVAVLLVVSQLFGEDSTIASVASSDNAELQQAMKDGEEAIKRAATSSTSKSSATIEPNRTDPTSLADFYGEEEPGEMVVPDDAVSDIDDDDDRPNGGATAEPAVVAASQPATTSSRPKPVEPWTVNK